MENPAVAVSSQGAESSVHSGVRKESTPQPAQNQELVNDNYQMKNALSQRPVSFDLNLPSS
jgi:hypothetical protein